MSAILLLERIRFGRWLSDNFTHEQQEQLMEQNIRRRGAECAS